jgi:dihydroorotase
VGLREDTTVEILREVKQLGCGWVKGFTQSVGNLNMESWETIKKQRLNAYEAGLFEIWHAEDFEILDRIKKVENYNEMPHVEKRPSECELSAVRKLLDIGYPYNLTFAHVTTARSARYIMDHTLQSTIELTPHHLFLCIEMLEGKHPGYDIEFAKLYQMNPALRWENDARFLREMMKNPNYYARIKNGSDHAPHTLEEKEIGMSGVPQLDTTANVVCELNKKYEIPWYNLSMVYSHNPARYLNLHRQGWIEEGMDASITILDLTPVKIETDNLYTKCGWSPFTGLTMAGSCSDSIEQGKFLKRDGQVLI